MTKVLFAALKDKKSSHDDNKRKSAFQTIAIELSKQTSKEKKGHLRLVIKSFRVGVVSSVLEQFTFVLLVSFLKTLNTFHTLPWCYYYSF